MYPAFNYFKRVDTLATIYPAPILTTIDYGGFYFDFDYTENFAFAALGEAAPDIVYEIDGGPNIVDPMKRYKVGRISNRDSYVDRPFSALKSELVVYLDYIRTDTATTSDVLGTHRPDQNSTVSDYISYLFDLAGMNYGVTDNIQTKTDRLPMDPASQAAVLASIVSNVSASTSAIRGADARSLTDLAGTGFSPATMSLKMQHVALLRTLGLVHENSVMDNTSFDTDNNLLSGRLRLYDSKTNADAALAASPGIFNTGKLAEYAITASYVGKNLKTYKVSLEG
jgi:hypothetical protein